jgi:hypothetical protein
VLSGLIVFPAAEAKSVLRKYRDFTETAPDDLTVWTVLRKAPPLPFLPAEVHGQPVVILALLYAGDPKKGEALVAPLHQLGTVLGAHVGVMPYTAWQQAFDPLLAAGARNYWKSHNFTKLEDGLFDTVVAALETLPSPHCEIFLVSLGGATMRPPVESAAYAHRETRYVINVHGRWETRPKTRGSSPGPGTSSRPSAPFSTGGVYVNFLTAEENDRVRARLRRQLRSARRA